MVMSPVNNPMVLSLGKNPMVIRRRRKPRGPESRRSLNAYFMPGLRTLGLNLAAS